MTSELEYVISLNRRNNVVYSDLPGPDAIRLLCIEDTCDPESICCTLMTIKDYREAPSYAALSYCWGDATKVAKMTCNGQPFFVTNSLKTALHRLRRCESSTHLFWIDAMCINQHDDTERSQQVSIMKQIYSSASRVFVWLGPGNERTRNAMRVIEETTDKCCKKYYGSGSDSTMSRWKGLRSERDLTGIANTLTNESCLDNLWSDLTPIFEREWFRRIWVIQEVQSCNETWILCGGECIEWCLVALVARAIFNRQNSIIGGRIAIHFPRRTTWKQYAIPHTRFMAQGVVRTASDVPFLRVLHQTRCFKSTGPRDKIYAMLQHPIHSMLHHVSTHNEFQAARQEVESSNRHGTSAIDANGRTLVQHIIQPAQGKRHLDMMPDYTKTIYAVYIDLAERSIVQTGTLDILSYRLNGQKIVPGIPSWVPHWDEDTTGWIIPLPTWQYNASSDLQCRSHVPGQILDLCGMRLGVVSQVSWTLSNREPTSAATDPDRRVFPCLCVDELDTIARTAVHDRRLISSMLDDEDLGARATSSQKELFADFAAWLVAHSRDEKNSFHCSTRRIGCDICEETIVDSNVGTSEPVYWYGCGVCHGGDLDICALCYSQG